MRLKIFLGERIATFIETVNVITLSNWSFDESFSEKLSHHQIFGGHIFIRQLYWTGQLVAQMDQQLE